MKPITKALTGIGRTSATAATIAGAGYGASKIVETLSAVSEKPVAQQKRFTLLTSGLTVLVGIIIGGIIRWKNKAESQKYREEKMADADAEVIKMEARARIETKTKDITDKSSEKTSATGKENVPSSEPRMTFIQYFKSKYQMPALPKFLETIMAGVPAGYEEPMLLHLLCMLGAMCFSKLRSVNGDRNTLQAANLQVIVEGNWGSGKGKFEAMYRTVFERVIEYSRCQMMEMDDDESLVPRIIQTTGIGTSMPKFIDILAGNQGCHIYMFNSEVKALANDLKKGNGLNFDYLRKAFENGEVCRNNKAKGSKNGTFPIFMNYTITGTPMDVSDAFKKELEGGTLSRIAWSCIPENGDEPAEMILPQGEALEAIRDQIDEWRSLYCFRTYGEIGDVAADTKQIDLDYINAALKEWYSSQTMMSKAENNPARKNLRIATIAFHCAMVLHAIYGFPEANNPGTRKQVVDLTIYIANYCQERFLHKFGKEQNIQRQINLEAEYVNNPGAMYEQQPYEGPRTESSAPELITDIPTLKRMHDEKDENGLNLYGWDKLSELSGIPRSTVRRLVKDYEKNLNQPIQ